MRTRSRSLLAVVLVFLCACGASEEEVARQREEAARTARAETLDEIAEVLAGTVRRVDERAGSANGILRPMPVMTPAEEAALRRYLNASHVARGWALGTRVTSEAVRDSLVAAGALVQLEDSTRYWIVRPRTSPAHVVPHLRALLEVLGRRFQERLAEMDLPPYRIEVTSALRTSARQARLRRSNPNAAAGVSSHEFGTTVDLSYAAFAPPAEPPPELLSDVPVELRPPLRRMVDLAFESVSGRKSRELGAIFSRVLREAQAEGIALVIYERQQTVYHLTVGRPLAGT